MKKRALIITGKYVQDHEYIYPYYRLQEAGFKVDVAIKNKEIVLGVNGTKVVPTKDTTNLRVSDYDLLIIPGGAKCMEYLRQEKTVIDFISKFAKAGKVIAAICHGSQMLISAKIVKGKKVSGYYSIRDDIENAGANYIDAPSVIDGKLVTSPHYKYLPQWMRDTLEFFK
ncbi:type 1 glutamine amidotransferase [Candidatus Daviesbacteria bacterium]|nr:type 1 glutamine amidotransferase [Candidatus Daviesbacteria bacterium]